MKLPLLLGLIMLFFGGCGMLSNMQPTLVPIMMDLQNDMPV